MFLIQYVLDFLQTALDAAMLFVKELDPVIAALIAGFCIGCIVSTFFFIILKVNESSNTYPKGFRA